MDDMSSYKIRAFIASFGPAWIVMMADVDAPSILTAAETGALFGYGLIWLLLVLTIPLFFIQEASGRIGIVTRRGLGEIIHENYSKRIALLASVPMALTDMLTYAAEYMGIAIGMQIIGIPPYVSIPSAFLIHLALVYERKYAVVESVLLGVSGLLLVTYVASLFVRGVSSFSPFYFSSSPTFLFVVAANAGALVMPCMPFYQASATAEKNVGSLLTSRIETLLGATVSECLMVIIIMVSVGLDGFNLLSPKELSAGLAVAGKFAPILFGVGLVAAGFLALTVVSLGSAWGVVEALGLPRSRSFQVYLAESIPAVLVSLIIGSNLLTGVLSLMSAFVFVLIVPGIMMGLIAADTRIMGTSASSSFWKLAYWISLISVVSLGLIFWLTSSI